MENFNYKNPRIDSKTVLIGRRGGLQSIIWLIKIIKLSDMSDPILYYNSYFIIHYKIHFFNSITNIKNKKHTHYLKYIHRYIFIWLRTVFPLFSLLFCRFGCFRAFMLLFRSGIPDMTELLWSFHLTSLDTNLHLVITKVKPLWAINYQLIHSITL